MDGTQTTPVPVILQHAVYPLSALDVLFERTTFVTGWLVEGTIDSVALGAALARMTEKWRMLAGRLVSQTVDEKVEWHLRIPLGPLPSYDEYPTFSLTTTISEQPLTDYVPIPFTSPSPSFPPAIFIHPSTPRRYSVWEGTSHPLTCWHLTYFPAGAKNDRDYTCIGFSRSHGLFDGGGAAMIMRALVAEMNGANWVVPPLPLAYPQTNVNPVKECIECEVRAQDAQLGGGGNDYSGMAVLGIKGALKLAAWHMKERWWSGAQRQILLLPKDGLTTLVEAARNEIKKWRGNAAGITTGDVLVAWLLKTIYSKGMSPDTIVNCGNLASFRHLVPSSDQSIEPYPHNAFAPLPYPLFTVSDLQTIPLHELTHILHTARSSYTLNHVGQGYKLVTQSVTTFLVSPHAHENLLISNVSASKILESDWRAVGAKRTLCGYRYQVTPNELLLTNSVFIAGRLEDGSTVLDVTLNKLRAGLLIEEVRRLSESQRMRVDV